MPIVNPASYAGRILKGVKPAESLNLGLQSSKFEVVINAQRRALMRGLTFPASLLAVTDEVIE